MKVLKICQIVPTLQIREHLVNIIFFSAVRCSFLAECVHTFSMDIELRNDRIPRNPFDRQFLDMIAVSIGCVNKMHPPVCVVCITCVHNMCESERGVVAGACVSVWGRGCYHDIYHDIIDIYISRQPCIRAINVYKPRMHTCSEIGRMNTGYR